MTDGPSKPDANTTPGMSTWVKVTLVALVVVAVVVVVVVAVTSGGIGGHQIPQHAPAGDSVASVPVMAPWM